MQALPSQQTVFRLVSRDGFEGLQPFQEPLPVLEKSDLLVKVRSVALNYRDIAIATGTYPLGVKDRLIPASDMAGEVVGVGEHVKGFSIGDSVISPICPPFLYGVTKDPTDTYGGMVDGMLAEYVTIPGYAAIKLPKSSHSFAQWASVIGAGGTAWNCFYGNVALKPGHTVLVQGTGGVSLTALVFAKAAGATTIVTSSSDEKLAQVKSTYGVDHTINYRTHPDWAAEVNRITNNEGADHILDMGGAGTIGQSVSSVAVGGVISLVGFLSGLSDETIPNLIIPAIVKSCVIRGILGASKQSLEEAVRYVASRELVLPVDKIYGFNREEIIAAMEYVAAGKHLGKVCINLE